MLTDYHCHILPAIDDGSDSPETSDAMVALMHEQGVERIVSTSHFYAHREKSVRRFIEKRQSAFEQLSDRKNIFLGAEIAIEHGISELDGIEKLAFEGTDLILLEFPYRPYEKWMSEEIYNIATEYKLTPVLAHIHRYTEYFHKTDLEAVLKTKAIFQINNEAFGSSFQKNFVKKLIKEEYPLIFGSDSHNLDSRRPNWDLLQKKCNPDIIRQSDSVFEKHMK